MPYRGGPSLCVASFGYLIAAIGIEQWPIQVGKGARIAKIVHCTEASGLSARRHPTDSEGRDGLRKGYASAPIQTRMRRSIADTRKLALLAGEESVSCWTHFFLFFQVWTGLGATWKPRRTAQAHPLSAVDNFSRGGPHAEASLARRSSSFAGVIAACEQPLSAVAAACLRSPEHASSLVARGGGLRAAPTDRLAAVPASNPVVEALLPGPEQNSIEDERTMYGSHSCDSHVGALSPSRVATAARVPRLNRGHGGSVLEQDLKRLP